MFRYVVSLGDAEYSDWIRETSCLSTIVIFRKDADAFLTSRFVWYAWLAVSLVLALRAQWTPWTLIQEVTVTATAIAALTMGSVLPDTPWSPGAVSRCAHFAIVGVCSKYRHTCWSSGLLSSLGVTLVLLLFGCWIASAAVAVRALLVEQSRQGRESQAYIPHYQGQ